MKITRKQFLEISGGAVLVAIAGQRMSARQEGVPAPARTRRWGMAIDLRKCLEKPECTKCIEVCNRAHNVPEKINALHEVKWIWKAKFESAFGSGQGSEYLVDRLKEAELPVFCNQCDQPPCVRVCPTQATWKREDGIVMMDWHRCIGCRYCMAACPYGSRSFNWMDPRPSIVRLNPDFPTRSQGVVEKCNFCEERIVEGLPPACVEACPQNAMTFGDLDSADSPIRQVLRSQFSIQRKVQLGTLPKVFYVV